MNASAVPVRCNSSIFKQKDNKGNMQLPCDLVTRFEERKRHKSVICFPSCFKDRRSSCQSGGRRMEEDHTLYKSGIGTGVKLQSVGERHRKGCKGLSPWYPVLSWQFTLLDWGVSAVVGGSSSKFSWNWMRFYHDHDVSEDVLLSEIDFFGMRTKLPVCVKVSITVTPFINVILHYCFCCRPDWEQVLIVSDLQHTTEAGSAPLDLHLKLVINMWRGKGMEWKKNGRESCSCIRCFPNLNALSCGRKVSLDNDCISHICYPTGVKAREAVMISWSDNLTSGVTQGRRNSCRSSCTPLWSQFVVDGGLETMVWCNLLKMDHHILGQVLKRFAFSESVQHAHHWALPSSCGSLLGTNTFCRLFQYKTNKSLVLGLLLSLKHLIKNRAGALNVRRSSIKCHWWEEKLLSTYVTNLQAGVLSNPDIVIQASCLGLRETVWLCQEAPKDIETEFLFLFENISHWNTLQGKSQTQETAVTVKCVCPYRGMRWYHFGMCFLSQVFVLVVRMSLS